MRLPDGGTQRDHCESYFRQTGQHYEGLEPVDCPEEAKYLWHYWMDMHLRRTSSGMAINPISNLEVLAWQHRRRIRLERFEEEVIDLLEFVYFTEKDKDTESA